MLSGTERWRVRGIILWDLMVDVTEEKVENTLFSYIDRVDLDGRDLGWDANMK